MPMSGRCVAGIGGTLASASDRLADAHRRIGKAKHEARMKKVAREKPDPQAF
jgi:hypothetical protein